MILRKSASDRGRNEMIYGGSYGVKGTTDNSRPAKGTLKRRYLRDGVIPEACKQREIIGKVMVSGSFGGNETCLGVWDCLDCVGGLLNPVEARWRVLVG